MKQELSCVFGLYRFVNFGYDHYQDLKDEGVRLEVFTSPSGKLLSMCSLTLTHTVKY